MHRRLLFIGVLALAAAAALLAGGQHASRAEARTERAANGAWIAYATASSADQTCCTGMFGSDIFIVQRGGTPKFVAGRGNASIWNVCPVFSPNGKLLAFGRKAPRSLPSISIVGVSRDGTISKRRIMRSTSKVHGAWATCPKWSADGKRIAYLDKHRRLVVMTIDGARRLRRSGDPAYKDFSLDATTVVSPDGALIARRKGGGCNVLVVSRPDGSRERVMDHTCNYWAAGWSPDSRRLLVMDDIGGARFTLIALSVDTAKAAPLVVGVQVNHARHQDAGVWPGYGDVSWQPRAL